MAAKHHPHQPKRRRSTSDLERRVRRIERSYLQEAKSIATHVARVEIDEAMAKHLEEQHDALTLGAREWREHPRWAAEFARAYDPFAEEACVDAERIERQEVAKHAPPN